MFLFQRNGPRGIPSGGIIITVDGTNFDVIREPKMYVVYREKEYTSVSKQVSTLGPGSWSDMYYLLSI